MSTRYESNKEYYINKEKKYYLEKMKELEEEIKYLMYIES